MAKLEWTEQLNIGIEVIDQQHRRIVDYINQLDEARCNALPREEIAMVIIQLKDYTRSHFTFEESMQEEAGYPFLNQHKKGHDRFIERIYDYQYQFTRGEDVSNALSSLLVTWLFNHIKRDDADFAESMMDNIQQPSDFLAKNKGFFSRLFE